MTGESGKPPAEIPGDPAGGRAEGVLKGLDH